MKYFPEYDAYIAEGVRVGTSWTQIAAGMSEKFGVRVDGDSVRKRATRPTFGLEQEVTEEETPEDRFRAKVDTEKQRSADRSLAREMAAAVKAKARWDEFLDIVSGELASTPRPDLEQLVIPVGSGTPETFTLMLGDIHVGKLVDPGVVGQGFGYGVPIFQERIARLKNRILRLFTLHSQTARFDRIRIYFMGDGVDGVDMRRGHAHRVDTQTATHQVLILVYAIEAMIRELSAALGIPVEVDWRFGNHGRVGDFGVNLPADNWDFIAGQMLAIALRDMTADGRAKLNVDSLKYSITQLGPYRVYSSHGDGIKGGDGFAGLPINGLARALSKDTGLHLQLFDLYLTAHFHTPQDITTQTGRIIMNGCWDGGDDYSVNGIKAASEPAQIAFGIHPERGMTWQSRIALAPARRGPTAVSDL